MRNARFSGVWYHPDGIPELQIPNEWVFTDYSGTPNPIDPALHSAFVRPEVRVLTPDYLPPAEWPVFVSPENTQVVKAFKGYGAWYSALSQNFDLAAGDYTAIIEVFPDLVDHYDGNVKVWAADPLSARVRVVIDGQAVTVWVNLLAGSRVKLYLLFSTSGGSNISFEFMLPFPLNNSGLFLSRLDVETAEPTPSVCRGTPRTQYGRTYHVYSPEATAEQRRALALHCADVQETFGPSFDDAGIGDLDIRNAVCHFIPAARHPEFVGWFAAWYPGVIVTFEDTPETLPDVIAYNQRDPAWSYLRLLPSTTTMGASGCLVTALAIYATLGDKTVTPGTLCICLRENGGFNSAGGLIFSSVSKCLPYMQFRNYVLWSDVADMAIVTAALSRGPTMLKVDWDVSDPDIDSHFVWAYDWTDEDHSDIKIIDPWTGQWTTILTAYPRGTIAQSVKGIVDFSIVDEPEPPTPIEPIRPEGTRGTIGLHEMQTGPTGIQNFLQTILPPAHLVAGQGGGPQLALAHAWSPDSLLLYRRVEDGLPIDNPGAAVAYVQRYIADLSPHFNLSDFSKPPIYLMSINERGYECGNAAGIQQGVAWDVAFMDAVEATGLNLKAGVYKAAVGNPHVTAADLSLLLPMVARACAGKHLLVKHSYYASVPDQPEFFMDSGMWYQFRFAQDDDYFTVHGYYPYWAPAEAGACLATIYPTAAAAYMALSFAPPAGRDWPNRIARIERDGDKIVNVVPVSAGESLRSASFGATADPDYTVSLNPGAGWKSCGSIQRYRDELIRCQQWYDNWNKTHGNRFLSAHLFTSGGWGWDQFDLQGGDLDIVTAGLNGVL